MQRVPEKVLRNVALLGDAGRAWLAGLPHLIAYTEREWAIKVGQPSRRASEAFVAQAKTLDGRDVVLKIGIPGIDPTRQERVPRRIARTYSGTPWRTSSADASKFLLDPEPCEGYGFAMLLSLGIGRAGLSEHELNRCTSNSVGDHRGRGDCWPQVA